MIFGKLNFSMKIALGVFFQIVVTLVDFVTFWIDSFEGKWDRVMRNGAL